VSGGPIPPGLPPPFGSGSPLPFPQVVNISDLEHQAFRAWHDLDYASRHTNARHVNRARIYTRQLLGAVKV
jgi:hypothetical protein